MRQCKHCIRLLAYTQDHRKVLHSIIQRVYIHYNTLHEMSESKATLLKTWIFHFPTWPSTSVMVGVLSDGSEVCHECSSGVTLLPHTLLQLLCVGVMRAEGWHHQMPRAHPSKGSSGQQDIARHSSQVETHEILTADLWKVGK